MAHATDPASTNAMLEVEPSEDTKHCHGKRHCDNQEGENKRFLSKRNWHIITPFLNIVTVAIIIFSVVYAKTFYQSCPDVKPCGPPCPSGWISYERSCYFFSKEKRSWTSSQSFCTSHHSSLAVIQREPEKEFLLEGYHAYKRTDGHWIGLVKDRNQTWKWVDGTQLNNMLEVKGGNCSYVVMGYTISSQCHLPRNWICSHPDNYVFLIIPEVLMPKMDFVGYMRIPPARAFVRGQQ